MAGELIEIRVRLTSRAHKFLTKRALELGLDRDMEAGRLLTQRIVQLISLQRQVDAAAAGEVPAAERTFTQSEVDFIAESERKRARRWFEQELSRLRAEIGGRDGD